MKTIELMMKVGPVQQITFFNEELAQKAYIAITTAMKSTELL